jgi:sterol desaturase/sphingolipid hydroxylase (fatty acid hydroxylase superfamily)
MDFLLAAVPGYLALMGVEQVWASRSGRDVYRLSDTFSNLACGLGSQLTGLLAALLAYPIYTFVYRHLAVVDLSARPALAWGVGALGVDFFYYWYHRASHRVNLFWATHAVHHQSERYNLSVALRQSWFSGFFSWIFYLPLALAGVPYLVYIGNAALSLLYQYLIHTESISSLGPLEWILNTPSHHRVHHGRNPEYVDKNYGATLILWDRLFGTFEAERERPAYGVIHPLGTWSAVRANVDPWTALWAQARSLPRWRDRWLLWWREPGWPNAVIPEVGARETSVASALEPYQRRYAYFLLVSAIAGGLFFLVLRESWTWEESTLAFYAVFGAFWSLGRLLDAVPGFVTGELLRLGLLTAAGGALAVGLHSGFGLGIFFYSLVSWTLFSLFSAWKRMSGPVPGTRAA